MYITTPLTVSNCLIAQFHASQTAQMKLEIIQEMSRDNSNIRVVFATSALGMGVNLPQIEQFIHISPPSSLEEFTQEVGRAGRNGENAKSHLFYNNSDICNKNIVDDRITNEMVAYCKTNKCLREHILQYYGFKYEAQEKCCCNCEQQTEKNYETPIVHQTKWEITPENFEKLTSYLNNFIAERDEHFSNSFDYFGFFQIDDAKSFSHKIEDL